MAFNWYLFFSCIETQEHGICIDLNAGMHKHSKTEGILKTSPPYPPISGEVASVVGKTKRSRWSSLAEAVREILTGLI